MSPSTLAPSLFDQLGIGSHQAQAALADEARTESGPARGAQHQARPETSGWRTLDELIVATWREVAVGATASCPVCHGDLKPVESGGSRPVGGRCEDCGSRLS